MRTSKRNNGGFTLIELLVVISIIAILAGLLLPVLSTVKIKAKVSQAKIEMNHFATAIQAYENDYSRPPAGKIVKRMASADDFTFGTFHWSGQGAQLLTRFGKPAVGPNSMLTPIYTANEMDYRNSNAELMFILMDEPTWPDATGNMQPTVNTGHGLNPKRTAYLEVKRTEATTTGGMGPDGVYRDPFGNPYIVSLDMNGDGRVRDAFYRLESVSGKQGAVGYNGLTLDNSKSGEPGYPNLYETKASSMIWSLGPDGHANSGQKANIGANKDNILSWQ